ncbi:hypothetical protein JCM6882_009390 [Rhodosporidiobolus microsporus]
MLRLAQATKTALLRPQLVPRACTSLLCRSLSTSSTISRPSLAANTRPKASRRTFWGSAAATSTAVETTSELASSSIPSVSADLLPLLFAVVLANAVTSDDEDAEAALHTPPWTVRAADSGAGQGAFASRPIALGEMLIAERPLCVWPNGLSEEEARRLFEQMSEKQKRVFLELTDGGDEVRGKLDEVRVRRACNAFSLPVPGVEGAGKGRNMGFVFPKIARVNHSCSPNCAQVMNWNTLRLELYAVAPVPTGTELTIEYLPNLITLTKLERQNALKTSFGFSRCLCPTCTAAPDEIVRSDARRREIRELVNGLRGGVKDRKRTLERMERVRVLCEEEGVRGLPDFGDESVNSSFAVYKALYARSQASA